LGGLLKEIVYSYIYIGIKTFYEGEKNFLSVFIGSSGDIEHIIEHKSKHNKSNNITNIYSIMKTLKHTITLLYINSVDNIVDTLNNIPNTKCTISSKTISSVTLSIELDFDVTFEDVLCLGTLIGSLETSSLI